MFGLMEMIQSLLKLAAYVGITSTCLVAGYRLFLHPLRKYPGPLLAKITDAYAGWYAILMDIHVRTRQDHLKYGPIMRYGPNRLIFSSLRALRDIYMNEKVSKSFAYQYTAATPGVFGVFNVIDKNVHSFKRRLVGKALSERSMKIFEPMMNEQIDIFIQALASSAQNSSAVNMTTLAKRLTFDIVALMAFGRPLKTQTETTYRSLIDAQTAGNHRSNIFVQFPFLNTSRIFSLLERLAPDKVMAYYGAIESMIAGRVAEDKHIRYDLYSILVDQINPNGEYLKDSEIWAEAAFFFPAGADTVSALLCSVFFYASRHPHVYEKLTAEIRSTFEEGEEIKYGPRLSGCRYLRATLDEALRISPPAPGTLWRELNVSDTLKPFVVDGHVIPCGVQVGVNTYALHHNEEYFPDPFTFRPERWFESETDAAQLKVMHEAFQAFSMGSRGCAGKSMAYTETSLVLARVIMGFDFEVAPGPGGRLGEGRAGLGVGRERSGEFQLYDAASATHDGPNLVFRLRNDLINSNSVLKHKN